MEGWRRRGRALRAAGIVTSWRRQPRSAGAPSGPAAATAPAGGGDRRPRGLLLALFVLIVAVHSFSEIKTTNDSRWTLHVAYSLVTEGNRDLAEWRGLIAPDDYRIVWQDGRPYTFFPYGTDLWATPIVALLDVAMRATMGRRYGSELAQWRIGDVQEFWASVTVALAALVLLGIGRRLGLTWRRATALALLFAFGTSAWSTASRALWSHTPALLCNAAALALVLRAGGVGRGPNLSGRARAASLLAAGLVLGFGFVVRPTGAVPAAVLAVLAWTYAGRRALWLLAGGAAVAGLFGAHNLAIYGRVLPPYYLPGRLAGAATLGPALLGNLVSPARGLFVFTPALLFAIPGAWDLLRARPAAAGKAAPPPAGAGPIAGGRALGAALVAAVALHWVAISSYPHWWGGYCYGPRLFTDAVPFLCVLLAPVLARWPGGRGAGASRRAEPGVRRWRADGLAFAAAALLGLGVHAVGANVAASGRWNGVPADIDAHPQRLWDWRDPQFLRWRDPAPLSSGRSGAAPPPAAPGRTTAPGRAPGAA